MESIVDASWKQYGYVDRTQDQNVCRVSDLVVRNIQKLTGDAKDDQGHDRPPILDLIRVDGYGHDFSVAEYVYMAHGLVTAVARSVCGLDLSK